MKLQRPFRSAWNALVKKVPLEAQLIITRRCNLSCGYCHEYDRHSPPVPLVLLLDRIRVLHSAKVIHITLLGGEPLLHPDLIKLVKAAASRAQVSVTTNGFLLSPALIQDLNGAGLTHLEISVDQIFRDPAQYIQKTWDALESKIKMLQKHAAFSFHVNVVVCPETLDSLENFLLTLRNEKIHATLDLVHTAEGKIALTGQKALRIWDQYYSSLSPLSLLDEHYGRALLEGRQPTWTCRAGGRSLYVDEFGNVQWCSSTRGKWNIPLTALTPEQLESNRRKKKGCEEGCAMLCVYRDSAVDNALGASFRALRLLVLRRKRNRNAKGPRILPAPSAQRQQHDVS